MDIGAKTIERKSALMLLAILLMVLVVYFRGLLGGYAFDDFPNIIDNAQLHVSTLSWNNWWAAIFSSPSSELQRPLAMFTFAINYFFTGLDPFPYKVTNLAIHLLNVVLAYLLARNIFRAWARRKAPRATPTTVESAALALTALWALAPINLTPVLLVVQRMESLAQVFVFAGLSLYITGRKRQLESRPGWRWIISGIIGCTMVGLLAKETAVAIPLYAFIIEALLFNFRGSDGKRDLRVCWFYVFVLLLPFIAGGAKLLPWVLSQDSYANRPFNLMERLLTEARVFWDYVQWTLVPSLNDLSLYHDDYVISRSWDHPLSTIVAITGLLAVLAAGFIIRKRRPLAALGIFLFFAAHALTGTVIPLELVYEHRNYFASFALLLVIVDVVMLTSAFQRPRLARTLAVCTLLGFFAFTTFLRASEWGNPIRFALSEAAKHPSSPRATYDEGRTYVFLSGYDPTSRFVPLARQALILASTVPNANILPEQALLILAARTGTPQDEAWWHAMQQKLAAHPIGVQEIGGLYALSKCQEEGHCHFDKGKMLDTFYAAIGNGKPRPDVLTIFANYAINALHDYDLAVRLIRGALEINPNNLQYHENLAKVLILLGQFDAAHDEIAQMKRLNHLGTSNTRIRAMEQRLQNGQALKRE